MHEFYSLLQLLIALVIDPRTGVLFALLVLAAVTDYRTYKIPNWLTFSGVAFGLIYNTAWPALPHTGFLWAFGGLLLGFLLMLPLYALRAMGAGDVKLMAMVGAFLGVGDTLHAALYVFIAGGVAALAFAFFNKALGRMIGNIKDAIQMMAFSVIGGIRPHAHIEAGKSVGKLPFGVSISIGTISYVVARQLGYA